MRQLLFRVATVSAAMLLIAVSAHAQGTTPPQGVRLGLNYALGTKPGVLVLPMDGTDADSVRAILQRDLDYSDAVNVVMLDAPAARAMVPATGDKFNYALFAKLGVVAVVRPRPSLIGMAVSVYDVGARKLVRSGDFVLPESANSRSWRMALHGVSDQVQQWIVGQRGVAQTRILYSQGGRIWVIDSDGANAQPLTASGGLALSPAWNPSGTSFVYSAYLERGSQIAVYDFDTGEMHWKSATSRGLNITPTFTPDGKSIVYSSGDEQGTNLVIADVGDNAPARTITVGRGSDNTSPAFSPDGRRIVFMSGRAGHPEVYTMDADGTNVQLLTDYTYGEQSYRASPDWSPDGRAIAYQSRLDGQFQIMTIDLRDRSTKQYTSDGENEDPSWAPDSRHLVFSSTRSGVKQLWVLDTESGRLRQLTHAAGARLAAWSPVLAPTNQVTSR